MASSGTKVANWKGVKRLLSIIVPACFANLALPAPTKPDLIALALSTADSTGSPSAVASAGEFWGVLDFEVRGNLHRPYKVRFQTPFHKMETPELQIGIGAPGRYRVVWGPLPVVVDRQFTLKATLVPIGTWRDANARNDAISSTVTPLMPANLSEFFGQTALEGRMTLDVAWNSNPGVVTAWMPNIASGSFQSVQGTSFPEWLSESIDTPLVGTVPIGEAYRISLQQSVSTIAAKQRVNRSLLAAVPFSAYQSDSPDSKWLAPEAYVQSQDPSIESFVRAIKRKYPSAGPFQLAEQLYLSIGKRCSYYSRPGLVPSASMTFRSKKGDCGGLSSLFVAACRNAGIPARTVVGFRLGQDRWHVWSEFYIPTAGWIACDLADAEAVDPKGYASAYFGVMPDLNTRVATSFGFDVTAGGMTLPILQSPSVFWSNGNAAAFLARSSCYLETR